MFVLLDETVHPSRYRHFILEHVASDVDVDEDSRHHAVSEGQSKWLADNGEESCIGSRKSEGDSQLSPCTQKNEDHTANSVGHWYEGGREDMDGIITLETYYIWSECDLKSEYNCKDKDYGVYAIPGDLEAHQFRIATYISWSRSLDWVIMEDCSIKNRTVALFLHSFCNRTLEKDHNTRRLFVRWARRTSQNPTPTADPPKV